jgi:hypothetical protein
MTQKSVLRAEVYARVMCARQNVKRAEVKWARDKLKSAYTYNCLLFVRPLFQRSVIAHLPKWLCRFFLGEISTNRIVFTITLIFVWKFSQRSAVASFVSKSLSVFFFFFQKSLNRAKPITALLFVWPFSQRSVIASFPSFALNFFHLLSEHHKSLTIFSFAKIALLLFGSSLKGAQPPHSPRSLHMFFFFFKRSSNRIKRLSYSAFVFFEREAQTALSA